MSSDRATDATMTAEELFSAAFKGDYDDEAPWDAVRALRQRNGDEVFRLAAAYSRSETPIQRARALDVLAQLGAGQPLSDRPHFNESVSIAIGHLEDENPVVVNSAGWALAHLNGEAAVSALIGIRGCSDDVRDALRKRLTDSFPEVRDEAIWGLARRKDPAALSLLLDRLNAEKWITGDEIATAEVLELDYDTPVDVLRSGLRDLLRNQ